jgi:hypothetical protein
MTRPPGLLGRRDRAPGGALRSAEAHRDELVVGNVGADQPVEAVHPLLDLVQERINGHHPPRLLIRAEASITQRHIVRHRLVITAGQCGRGAIPTGQVERLQNLHDLLTAFHLLAFRPRHIRSTTASPTPPPITGNDTTAMGKSVAVSGEIS